MLRSIKCRRGRFRKRTILQQVPECVRQAKRERSENNLAVRDLMVAFSSLYETFFFPADQGHFPPLLGYQLTRCHGLHNVQESTGVLPPPDHSDGTRDY